MQGIQSALGQMIEDRKQGKTLQEIADGLGVSRQRVHQVLKKNNVDSPPRVVRQVGRDERKAKRDRKSHETWGCSFLERKAIPARAIGAYRSQKGNARTRGIEWRFTLYEWWMLWQASGLWEQRGRGHGYVMARRGDVGPYSADNVYICSQVQNMKDSYIFKPAKIRKKPKRLQSLENRC